MRVEIFSAACPDAAFPDAGPSSAHACPDAGPSSAAQTKSVPSLEYLRKGVAEAGIWDGTVLQCGLRGHPVAHWQG
jgi:hypothetical protein